MMQHEFDNTIDLLLRRQAGRESEAVSAETAHFEADEIAAFAEDVLLPKARARYIAHFADCGDCRRILSNFITINEAESEVLIAAPEISLTKLSWRKRFADFFTLPVLGYATAAMAIMLVGSFALVALRSPQPQSSAVVALNETEKAEKTAKEKTHSAPIAAPKEEEEAKDAPPEPSPTTDDTNAQMPETFPQPEGTPADVPPSYRVVKNLNTNAPVETKRASEPAREEARNTASNTNQAASTPPVVALTQPNSASVAESDAERQRRETKEKQAELAKNKPEAADKANEEALQLPLKNDSPSASGATAARAATMPAPRTAAETQTVGGRIFARENGVWKDSAYGRQNLNIVRRSSDEYKKLDAGLRSIADNLGGAVIVVWQGKAYKIQ